MADSKITALTANTAPLTTDILPMVDDPSGTPTTQKITFSDFLKVINGLTEDTAPDALSDFLLSYDASASSVKKLRHNNALSGRPSYSGTMVNGKVSPTVATGTLTLTLQTAAGSTPSSTDPVLININGTWRSVTSSITCTLAAATNWFNAGSAALATKEIDYFIYAIWDSNSSTVAIAPARIPSARLVSDFSATTTNEKYIGNYANYTTTDDVCVIGRFAATLSAGAGYTWSVPTYTNSNLIRHPIYNTRSLSWTGAITSGSGTPTNPTSTTGTYIIENNRMFLSVVIPIVTKNTAAGSLFVAGPFTPTAAFAISSAENSAVGVACNANYQTTPRIAIVKYDATTIWVDGYNIVASGWVLI